MIQREAAATLRKLASQYKAVAIVGPRQSGKTTLSRFVFPEKAYVNFENPDIRLFATQDPRGFLSNYPEGAIFDEAQRVPDIFSYLQQILDESNTKGLFIISGSNNFLLQESISQSLAGRVGYIYLLPLTIQEIGNKSISSNDLLFKGSYPVMYSESIDPDSWYSNYIRTYVERDVRLLKNISNLTTFERFLRLCAARVGQLLNMNSLAIEVGVDTKTINSWIGILESTFIAFRLQPYYKNFSKRIVKMPKFYFYDTGLAAALLGIEDSFQLDIHMYKGALFENLIVVDFIKSRYNLAKTNNIFFWRDSVGNELDILIENGNLLIPIEVKSGQTVTNEYFKGLRYWEKIGNKKGGYIVYAGKSIQRRSDQIAVVPFNEMELIRAEMQDTFI
jgi:predicted AAA+ superfamily ATPase